MVSGDIKDGLLSFTLMCVMVAVMSQQSYAAAPAADPAETEKAAAAKAAADKAAAAKAAADKAAAEKLAEESKKPPATLPDCPAKGDLSSVRVTDVTKNNGKSDDVVQLGNEIRVKVDKLKILSDHAKCSSGSRKVLLFLDGRPITNVSPEPPTDPAQEYLIFPLRRDDKSRESWTAILGRPTWNARPVTVSVGLDGEYPVKSEKPAQIMLELMPKYHLAFWLALVAVAVWRVLKNGDMLRAPGSQPAPERPYSLARVQMMWWFFITLASYLFIGIITGDYSSTITGTVLVLTGISAGTGLLAGVIDRKPDAPARALAPTPVPGPAPTPVPGATPAPAATGPIYAGSRGFWADMVSDSAGYSVHRYQMAVWTVVLGLIFIWSVYLVLAMPQFSETLLALMGISAGTYISVKNVET